MVVPCGDGNIKVYSLIQQAAMRYRKAIAKVSARLPVCFRPNVYSDPGTGAANSTWRFSGRKEEGGTLNGRIVYMDRVSFGYSVSDSAPVLQSITGSGFIPGAAAGTLTDETSRLHPPVAALPAKRN